MKAYYVKYRMHDADEAKGICVAAKSKEDAYDKALYEMIPERESSCPYSAWVYSVTYSNGKEQRFNTSEGNPY